MGVAIQAIVDGFTRQTQDSVQPREGQEYCKAEQGGDDDREIHRESPQGDSRRQTGEVVTLIGPLRSKDGRRQENLVGFELLDALRSNAGWPQAADDLAVFKAGLLKLEDVLENDGVTLHPLDFRNVRNLATSVAEALLVDDQ